MKILFINPSRPLAGGREIGAANTSPHIGLAYIAAVQRTAGRDVRVIDAHALNISDRKVAERIREFGPDIIGISAYTSDIKSAHELARAAKAVCPAAHTVIGGCHVTALPHDTLNEFEAFDFAVQGEGESVFASLADAISQGAACNDIKGIAFRENGGIVLNDPAVPVQELDSLPRPAFELFPLDRYRPFYGPRRVRELPVSTSRGCPFQCIFCAKPSVSVRYRTVASIIDEISEYVEKFAVRQIFFTAESFTLKGGSVAAFCEEFMKAGLHKKVNWLASSRVDIAPETVFSMRAAGCSHLLFGIESGNQDVLDKVCKGITLEQARAAADACRRAGVVADGAFIIGLPYDTEKTVRDTIRFAANSSLSFAGFFLLVPFPGSKAFELAKNGEAGLRLVSRDWNMYSKLMGDVLEHSGFSRKRLRQLQLSAYLRFYTKPKRIVAAFRKVSPARMFFYLTHVITSIFKP